MTANCAGQMRVQASALRFPRSARSVRSFRPTCAASVSTSLDGLKTWLAKRGTASDSVAITSSFVDNSSLLVAAKDLNQGETVLAVPDNNWLSPQYAAKIVPQLSTLEPWLQIAVLLMIERSNSNSELRPYLDQIESENHNPLLWPQEDLRLLEGSQVLQDLASYREFFKTKYAELQDGLFKSAIRMPAEAQSWSNFCWAVATVRSRSHAPLENADVALVPLADSVRHSRKANVVWKTKASGLFGRGRQLCVETTRNIRKGEELTMDYAPGAPDSQVVRDYGVLDRDNLQPGYNLHLALPASDRYLDDKLDILENSAKLPVELDVVMRAGQPPSSDMMAYLRLKQLSGADSFLLESIFRNEIWDHVSNPVSADNEAAVCAAMAKGAAQALSAYPTTLEQDFARLRDGSLVPGTNQEVAVQVVAGEKEVLDSLQRWFEARSSDLRGLEYYQERRLKRLGLMTEDGRSTYDNFFKDGIA